jgi:hypothetical protein
VDGEPFIEGLVSLEAAVASFIHVCFVTGLQYPKVPYRYIRKSLLVYRYLFYSSSGVDIFKIKIIARWLIDFLQDLKHPQSALYRYYFFSFNYDSKKVSCLCGTGTGTILFRTSVYSLSTRYILLGILKN